MCEENAIFCFFCYRKGKCRRNGRKRWKNPSENHKKVDSKYRKQRKYRKIKNGKWDVSQKYMVSDKEKDQ